MNYIIFGGSGFIGTHLIHLLKEEVIGSDDRIYDLDIVMPGEEGVVPGIVDKIEGVEYVRADVRREVSLDFTPTKDDVIFNLAAVHRTPGHADQEYFETNIKGAENVTAFAERCGITKILFTSSIAPYGASEECKDEDTLPTPNTPYGISKLVAEEIHRKWQAEDREERELTIVRPGVVYGKGEHGNMTRLYWGMRNRYFFYTGRKDTIKACIYVKELVRFFKYRMVDNHFPGADCYNCTFDPAYTIEEICRAMQKATEITRYIPLVPARMLMTAARVLGPIGGKKVGIHPERVKKLMVSTNISGKKLADCGYGFHYTLEESFRDWFEDCNEKGLDGIAEHVQAKRRDGEPVRIAQMMTDMNFGGVEMVVMNYYRHIDRGRFQFDFYALEGSSIPQKEEIERLGGRVFVVPKYTHLPEYEKRVTELLVQNGYEIVHSHMNTLSVFSLYAAERAGVPNRIAHNHSTAGKGETKKNAMKYALRPLAGVYPTEKCACSVYSGKWIFGKDAEFHVFHNAIDLRKFTYNGTKRGKLRRVMGLEGKFVVGHIGRFCYQKNHELLIDIFNELVKQRRDAVLLLIGEGELLPEVRRKVHRMGLGDCVKFLGPRKDAYRFYQVMDVFVLPSRYEGLPVVGVEAQAAGLPCVMSDQVSGEAGILDSTVFISPEAPVGNWVSAICRVAENFPRRDTTAELREAGFDIDRETRKLEEFYMELLGKTKSQTGGYAGMKASGNSGSGSESLKGGVKHPDRYESLPGSFWQISVDEPSIYDAERMAA